MKAKRSHVPDDGYEDALCLVCTMQECDVSSLQVTVMPRFLQMEICIHKIQLQHFHTHNPIKIYKCDRIFPSA